MIEHATEVKPILLHISPSKAAVFRVTRPTAVTITTQPSPTSTPRPHLYQEPTLLPIS